MTTINGRAYVGKWSVSESLVEMCKALGVVLTEDMLGALAAFTGKGYPLYKSTIKVAPDGYVLSMQAQELLDEAKFRFEPSVDTLAAWKAWKKAEKAAANDRAQIENAREQAAALMASLNLPPGTINVSVKPSGKVKEALELFGEWGLELLAQVKARTKARAKAEEDEPFPAEVIEYALQNVRVTGDKTTGGLASLTVMKSSKAKSGNGAPRGNKRSFMTPTYVGNVKWDGSWRKTAVNLQAAGLLGANSNAYKHPALERIAAALPDTIFRFGDNEKFDGEHIAKNIDQFSK